MNPVSSGGPGSGGRIRTERVGGFIRQEIADMLLKQEVHDPRLGGFVSITDVQVSRDLQHATVYFSVVAQSPSVLSSIPDAPGEGDEAVTRAQQALNHAAGFIRSQLGRRLHLRYTPHLRFVPDHSLEYGMRMNRLLNQLHIPPAEEAQ